MKKFYLIYLFTFATVFWSCSKDSDIILEPVNISLNFSHTWNGQEVTSSAIDTSRFINEIPDESVEKNEIGINEKDEFDFNQDGFIEFDEEYRSPGWDRYKKNKLLKWKK